MEIKIGLVGAGMFGGDVHARCYAELQRCGVSAHLGRLGLGKWSRDLAPIQFRLAAIATRTRASAERAASRYKRWTGSTPRVYWGERPWTVMLQELRDLDVVAVATPDHLHTPVILHAVRSGVHVLCEKPLCLDIHEADQILQEARIADRIVALDMHKRYDPDHLRIRKELLGQIGEPLYGTAYLEEPLAVSTKTFKWVEQSDPFSYVGSHWVDLIEYYFDSKPRSLTAVGQKRKLKNSGIDAFDSVQVRVDYANGLSMSFHNNWITPSDFEGPVNQGHEIVGTNGKIESDQQYRGLRWWHSGGGTRTANTHFARPVPAVRDSEEQGFTGYGVDSLIAGLAAICRARFFGATCEELSAFYPNLKQARVVVAILHAARVVRDLNYRYLAAGKGAGVTARFGRDGITILDPMRGGVGRKVLERIYDRPI